MIHQAIASATEPEEMPQDDAGFLAVVRAFFDQALTPDLRQAGRETLGVHSNIGACKVWHRRLFERGWIAPAWPVEFGGTGWSARQRFLFDRECARQDAPVLFIGGIRSLGPLLIEQGTPEQRARFLIPMLSGRDLWCQGFSEPGAGSDLAAISTRAVREGDHYIVNGSKIWTMAKRLMQLARSNNTPAALVGRVLRRTAEAALAAGDQIEPSVRTRLAELMIALEAFEQLELSGFADGPMRPGDQALPSMLKLTGSELHQQVAELAMEIAGPQAAATLAAIGLAGAELDDAAKASAKHLCVRAATIYSGTSETQRNVIAHQILANQWVFTIDR